MERTLVASDFPQPTLRAVALAYRARRQAGKMHVPAHLSAMEAHRHLHPETDEKERGRVVVHMICVVALTTRNGSLKDVAGMLVASRAMLDELG